MPAAGRRSLVVLLLGSLLAAPAAAAPAKKAPARKATTQLVSNGSFESSLSGWGTWNATMSRPRNGVVGKYSARASARSGVTSFSIAPDPASVSSTIAGSVYTAQSWVRTDHPGREICLRIREWSAASVVGSASACVIGSKTWQRLPAVAHTTYASGRTLDFYVYVRAAVASDRFDIDGVSLTRADAPLAPPTALVASGVSDSSVSLAWTPSIDPRVVKYEVRVGGSSVGSATGSSFTVGGLACGTSYTFGVRGLDAAGATSSEATVAAATAACPPPPSDPEPAPPDPCARYASLTGSDSAAGTLSAPFRTAAKLVASLGAGETGCLQPGTYVEDVKVSAGGAPGLPITVTSASRTSPATLQGRLWVAESANDVVFSHLVIDGRNSRNLPSPTVNGDRVVFRHNDVSNANNGICFVLGSEYGYGIAYDALLEYNRIHNCGKLPATNTHHGVYVERAVNARILNNYIYDNADRGIQLYPDAQGTVIMNNVIDGNGEGIIFSGASGWASSNNYVANNVITNSMIRFNVESWWPSDNPIGTGNLVERNCLWNGKQGNVQSPQVGFTAVNNLVADPLFVDRAAKDFRLRADSPCAGMGPTG